MMTVDVVVVATDAVGGREYSYDGVSGGVSRHIAVGSDDDDDEDGVRLRVESRNVIASRSVQFVTVGNGSGGQECALFVCVCVRSMFVVPPVLRAHRGSWDVRENTR